MKLEKVLLEEYLFHTLRSLLVKSGFYLKTRNGLNFWICFSDISYYNWLGVTWIQRKLFFRWPDEKSEACVKDGVPVHQDIIVYDFDPVF